MSLYTIDFETYYEKTIYTLKRLTYEQYIRDPKFKVHGVSIRKDAEEAVYYPEADVRGILESIFVPGNQHTLVAHNMLFDGAIFSWYYGLRCATYYCTQAISRALWNQERHTLDALAKRLWPEDDGLRKGDELANFAGVVTLTEEQQQVMGGYCINDNDITFHALRDMLQWFPAEELPTLNNTLRMFLHPVFELDRERVIAHRDEITERKKLIFDACRFPQHVLRSTRKLAVYLRAREGIRVQKIHSPTTKNPDNRKYPFAKDDLEFLELQAAHPDLKDIWEGRLAAASNIDVTRATRMLEHADPVTNRIAMPLNYSKAHTHRWGGANKLNPQNFRRGSELRKALRAPKGHKVIVRDLSNIEGRMLAWWAGERWKCRAFAEGRDLYNEFASEIFNRTIDRKRTEIVDGKEINPDFVEGFVGKTCELGLGYQMGAPKLRTTFMKGANGGPRMFFTEDQCYDWVTRWRTKNIAISTVWREAQNILLNMADPTCQPFMWRGLEVQYRRIKLPNGLFLNYPGLRFSEESTMEWPKLEYWNGKHWTNIYGGKFVENIIQALARIVIAYNMRQIDDYLVENYTEDSCAALTVHDEVVAVAPEEVAETVYEYMGTVMAQPPEWCSKGGLVLASEGGIDDCYSK